MRKKFIRVFLKSGTRMSLMGEEEVAVYCQCEEENPSAQDVDVKVLENWVNDNRECKKNQNNDLFKVSKDLESIKVIVLDSREIQCCQKANRIFPPMPALCPGV